MNSAPSFFVPLVDADKQEAAYEALALVCGTSPLPPGSRIYSITFVHHSGTWSATVGQVLSGTKTVTKKVRGERVERTQHLSDNATVLAIFPGYPYLVVHDGNRSKWENPFFAGQPESIRRFLL